MLQKKTNGAPNGFYAEIDWDRYVSVLGASHPSRTWRGTRAVLTCLLAFWVAVAVSGDVQVLIVPTHVFVICTSIRLHKTAQKQGGSGDRCPGLRDTAVPQRKPWVATERCKCFSAKTEPSRNRVSIPNSFGLFVVVFFFFLRSLQNSPELDEEGYSIRPEEPGYILCCWLCLSAYKL